MLQAGLDIRLRFGIKRTTPSVGGDGHLRHALAGYSLYIYSHNMAEEIAVAPRKVRK